MMNAVAPIHIAPAAPLELPAILADLERRLSALPPDAVPPALATLASLQAGLAARLIGIPTAAPLRPPEDRLLTADEAAARLGTRPRWLRRHAARLPFTRRLSRKCVRYSEAGLMRWLAARKA